MAYQSTTYQPYKSNPGWGAAATQAKPSVYQPTNPGWGAASTKAKNPLAGMAPGSYFFGAMPPQTGQPAAPSNPNYQYQIDPAILAAFKASSAQRRSARDRNQRDLLMKSGLYNVAQKMFGGDAAWLETVKNNPFSDMSNIKNAYEGRLGKINQANEDLNSQNLFYSSTRTNDVLPSIYRQRGQDEYGVEVATRDSIAQIEDAFIQAELQDKIALAQAQQAGAMSAAQDALTSGWNPGAPGPASNNPLAGFGLPGFGGYQAPSAPTGGGSAPVTYGQGSSGWNPGDGPTINGQSPTERAYMGQGGFVNAPRYAKQPDWQPYNGNYYRDSAGNIFNGTGRLVKQAG